MAPTARSAHPTAALAAAPGAATNNRTFSKGCAVCGGAGRRNYSEQAKGRAKKYGGRQGAPAPAPEPVEHVNLFFKEEQEVRAQGTHRAARFSGPPTAHH